MILENKYNYRDDESYYGHYMINQTLLCSKGHPLKQDEQIKVRVISKSYLTDGETLQKPPR
jgi:hypothetical protein